MEQKIREIEKTGAFWLKLWDMLAPSRRELKILFVLMLISESARLIGPYFLKIIIDKLTVFDPSEAKQLILFVALFFFSEEANSLIFYFRDRRVFKILIEIEYYLMTRAQEKLVFLPLSYHEKENTGNKITKIERGIFRISELMNNIIWEVAPTSVQLIATLIVLLFVDWRFGLSFAFFVPIFIFITYKANIELYPVRKKRHEDEESASGRMAQSIININTVKSFVQENREVNEFGKFRGAIRDNEKREWFRLLNFGLYRNLIIDLGRLAIFLLGVYLVFHGSATIGTLVFVITLSEKAYFSLYRLSRFYDRVEQGSEAINRFYGLINEKSDIINPKNGIKPKKINGRIEFRGVNFAYNQDSRPALDQVSLKINSGCVTALVGPSGGGKTTLARMIYRHYDPQRGEVAIDGVNLKNYDLYGFRKFIAIVPQEVEIFSDTVKNNIAYAKTDASFEEIRAAARIANAEEFIDNLPDKYNTEVGERGVKLSGGQRQRIGIARAILANPRILIFDEATSNLDSESERLIQRAMEKVTKGRTTILIAHRLSTIRRADKIVVLENGQVAEEGSHYELSHIHGGLYAKLLSLQEMGHVE